VVINGHSAAATDGCSGGVERVGLGLELAAIALKQDLELRSGKDARQDAVEPKWLH
jgi:hypothetical protein